MPESLLDSKVETWGVLGNVKMHLAEHNPMTEGDEAAWWLCDELQNEAVGELAVSRG